MYRFLSAIVAVAVLALAGVAVQAPTTASAAAKKKCHNAHLEPRKGNVAKVRRATLCLVNRERTSRGLRKLRGDRRLRRAAVKHSRDMVARGYFSHVAPSGSTITTRARAARYIGARSAYVLAENLAWGTGSESTPARIVRAWMRSPGHRANILLKRVRDAGVGVALGSPQGGRGGTFTMAFGRRG